MEWLSKSTKRLLAEMSAGILFYNVILIILAVLLLPRISYPVVSVVLGLIVGAVGAICMLIHMAVTTERVLDSGSESYANKYTAQAGTGCGFPDLLESLKDRSSGSGDRNHGHESRRIPAATGSQNFRWKRTGSFCAGRYFRQ